MERTARHYLCARCRTAVLICSHCDRGQRYCAGDCAERARGESIFAAGQRNQNSRPGRIKHAARQCRYRARLQEVTHQGSPPPTPNDLLPVIPMPRVEIEELAPPLPWPCHFCGQLQAQFMRRGFLRRRIRRPLRLPDSKEALYEYDP